MNPTKGGVSNCDCQASTMSKTLPTRVCRNVEKTVFYFYKVTASLYWYGAAYFTTIQEPL